MANMGNMVIVSAERLAAIRTHIGGGFGSWDDRPSQTEMMALLNELIGRRAQDAIQQPYQVNGSHDAQDHVGTIARLNSEIDRKNYVIDTLTRDEGAARQNNISAHRRIAELEAGMKEVIANNEQASKTIAELEASNNRKKSYIGKVKAKHAELVLQLKTELAHMTESNRGHVIALKRAKMTLNRLAPMIESEISDFFAGAGAPGEPETPEVMQAQLTARIINIMAGE